MLLDTLKKEFGSKHYWLKLGGFVGGCIGAVSAFALPAASSFLMTTAIVCGTGAVGVVLGLMIASVSVIAHFFRSNRKVAASQSDNVPPTNKLVPASPHPIEISPAPTIQADVVSTPSVVVTPVTVPKRITIPCQGGAMPAKVEEKRKLEHHPLYEVYASLEQELQHKLLKTQWISHAAGYVFTEHEGSLKLVVKRLAGRKIEVPGGYGTTDMYSFLYMLTALRSELWHEGNVVPCACDTRYISPPVISPTVLNKFAIIQGFFLEYDQAWVDNLKCHENPKWTIELMDFDSVEKRGQAGEFSTEVFKNFQLLRDMGILATTKERAASSSQGVILSQACQDFVASMFPWLLDASIKPVIEVARLPEDQNYLLPLSENDRFAQMQVPPAYRLKLGPGR